MAEPGYSGPEEPGAANQAAIFTRRAATASPTTAATASTVAPAQPASTTPPGPGLPHGMSCFWGPQRVAVLPELSAPAPEPVLGIKRLLSEGAVAVACRRPSKMTVLLDDSDVEEL
jgi:hypothetical protein